ncbi:MAG: class I SAM-dependent methyltransferase [Clostridiaceae bacterium]|nr:class I SAM-dependent methyltransferase [Clostridiaceae bacterium]
MDKRDWGQYHKITRGIKPKYTAVKAIELFNGRVGTVIDLGCGSGGDTLFFIENGWECIATDMEIEEITRVESQLKVDKQRLLSIKKARFEELTLEKAELVNASFCLGFCDKNYFKGLWNRIVDSIKHNGRFAGTFFGDKDSWKRDNKDMTFLSKEEVTKIFNGFEFEYLIEEERDGHCIDENGELADKHWHIFEVVARKVKEK